MRDEDYRLLLELRTELRRFLRWSSERAEAAGISPQQYQLLLVVRGHHDPTGPTIADAADYLLLRHHSVVELVDRAVKADLIERRPDPDDARRVRLRLTALGGEILERLVPDHAEELRRLGRWLHEVDHLGEPVARSRP